MLLLKIQPFRYTFSEASWWPSPFQPHRFEGGGLWKSMHVLGSQHLLDVREALDDMRKKMEEWGCQRLAKAAPCFAFLQLRSHFFMMWVHLAVKGKFYKAIVPPLIIVMAAAGNQCANTAPTAWHPAQSECQGLSCQNGLCKERLFKLVAHAGATRVKADRSPPFCSPVTESVHQPVTVIRRVSTSRGQFQWILQGSTTAQASITAPCGLLRP